MRRNQYLIICDKLNDFKRQLRQSSNLKDKKEAEKKSVKVLVEGSESDEAEEDNYGSQSKRGSSGSASSHRGEESEAIDGDE